MKSKRKPIKKKYTREKQTLPRIHVNCLRKELKQACNYAEKYFGKNQQDLLGMLIKDFNKKLDKHASGECFYLHPEMLNPETKNYSGSYPKDL